MDRFTCTGQQIKQFFLIFHCNKKLLPQCNFLYCIQYTCKVFRKLEYKASFRKKVANYFTKKSMPGGERPERKKSGMRGIGKKVLYQHSSRLISITTDLHVYVVHVKHNETYLHLKQFFLRFLQSLLHLKVIIKYNQLRHYTLSRLVLNPHSYNLIMRQAQL